MELVKKSENKIIALLIFGIISIAIIVPLFSTIVENKDNTSTNNNNTNNGQKSISYVGNGGQSLVKINTNATPLTLCGVTCDDSW